MQCVIEEDLRVIVGVSVTAGFRHGDGSHVGCI
jgi:hypothetical protein